MKEQKNKSIADTFNSRLKTPWVWLVIVLTLGLTILFSLSQKPQMAIYSQHIKTLSDFQLLNLRFSRSMEQARTGYGLDSMQIISQTMTLREMAVSFSRQMDELQGIGMARPSQNLVNRFEREVLGKVSASRRYLNMRSTWLNSLQLVSLDIVALPLDQQIPLRQTLDSARAGFVVEIPSSMELPDSLFQTLSALLNENKELGLAWNKIDNDVAELNCEELIQFFQMERLKEISLNAKIPVIFYFLTLVLLLSTFFFLFRSRL